MTVVTEAKGTVPRPADGQSEVDVVVIYEHPEWQKPLFEVLEARGVSYRAFSVVEAQFSDTDIPTAAVYFNQVRLVLLLDSLIAPVSSTHRDSGTDNLFPFADGSA